MASIPCATYQAGNIHAQMRRQNARSRHSSGASLSSQEGSDSSSTPGSPHDTIKTASFPMMKTKMSSVSEWLNDNLRRMYGNIHIPGGETKSMGVVEPAETSIPTAISTNADAMMKS